MGVSNATQKGRTVEDPNAKYESMRGLWARSRAVCSGERFVKEYDAFIDVNQFTNLLIPFSPTMTQEQFNFFKAEAELPGVVSQYAHILVGGLLRKQPQLVLPDDVPEGALDWIMTSFAQDGSPLTSFLDDVLWEEMQTSRAWVFVDYPVIKSRGDYVTNDFKELKPYPVFMKAESIINWRMALDDATGVQKLTQVIVRDFEETLLEGDFHPTMIDTVWVHEIVNGFYQIRKYQKKDEDSSVPVANGQTQQNYSVGNSAVAGNGTDFEFVETIDDIESNGERLTRIPAWPLNGSVELIEPILTPLIDREINLYNKVSRRNHLLYGAATYTPVIASDMDDDSFEKIVSAGLGSWLKLSQGDTATILDTPTDALSDMDRAIAATLEEMGKMGIRMLAPESAQSGVALEIRNAAQTAQLGTLNTKISNQMADIIAFMINWRYGTEYAATDIEFNLSADFNPAPIGADWLRLVTEWYESGLIPRKAWLQIVKQNDILSPDYDDETAQEEITADEIINGKEDEDLDEIDLNN
jgi:hypothetical protein